MTEQEILRECNDMQTEMIAWRRFLHEHAEVGFHLETTREFVLNTLSKMGIDGEKIGRSGVVANLGKPRKKGAFLLRADMDGLPIKEESGETFSAKNGNMHACGHDLHTAMLLGATKVLKTREKELKGAVKILFQPAEERLEGAKDALSAGLLRSPKVNGGMMLHVLAGVPLPTGALIVAEGVSAPACDYFTITVTGKGCHGSSPHQGVDALLVASQIAIALQTPIAREISPNVRAVLTIGSIRAGDADNVIPERAILKGTLRSFDERKRKFLKTRVKELVQSIAKGFRATAEVVFPSGCPALLNDDNLSQNAYRVLKGAQKSVYLSSEFPSGDSVGGSEDFAYISQKIPSVMVGLVAGKGEYGLHNPKVCFDESVLPIGATAYALMALELGK
ncbi:MAG: amidohydrolase [Clostridia bacterium]|nr:amidohydrolase [Clostridia bacterium]